MRRVLDVRFRPQSRRPGMSKTRLGDLLAEHGIAYENRRELGTPRDLRFLSPVGPLRRGGRGLLRAGSRTPWARELDALATELASAPPTALLCLEADPAHCHRTVVARALQARAPGLRIVDL